jgi:predicted nuclease with TOPRIM domain
MNWWLVWLLAGWAVWMGGAGSTGAYAQINEASDVLNQSSTLLREQQELDARLGVNRARLEELQLEQKRMNSETERLNADREANQSLCGGVLYYTQRAECDQQSANITNSSQNLTRQRADIGQRWKSTTAEIESLKARREKLDKEAEAMNEKLRGLELSGAAKECLARLPQGDLNARVTAYQQCWDGTSSAEPRFKQETPTAPAVEKPGPIEQMGIEEEKRRKRREKRRANE